MGKHDKERKRSRRDSSSQSDRRHRRSRSRERNERKYRDDKGYKRDDRNRRDNRDYKQGDSSSNAKAMTREEMIRLEQEKRRKDRDGKSAGATAGVDKSSRDTYWNRHKSDSFDSYKSPERVGGDKSDFKRDDKLKSSKHNDSSKTTSQQPPQQQSKVVQAKDLEEIDEQDIASMFGFAGFDTTKGKDHQDQAEEAVYKQFIMKRDHRQFMNKKPGVSKQSVMQPSPFM
eukprot:403363228